MNPGAVELYQNQKIDLFNEPLEVAICAQHNNGGLAGNSWYESTNLKHLFPIGEVNGSHGVTRPGGSALNAGQVGGFRAAEFIANRYSGWTLDDAEVNQAVSKHLETVVAWAAQSLDAKVPWLEEMQQIQERMSRVGAYIRSLDTLIAELPLAWEQVHRLSQSACGVLNKNQIRYAFRVRQLAYAQVVYLEAIKFMLESGVGSRGSAIVLDPEGNQVHELLDSSWKIAKEDESFRTKVLETVSPKMGEVVNQWVPCRPIPDNDSWFETIWARYRNGEIYR
jgi:succinate dehydrogenase/fumarate reductase flavoprotein subunit